MFNKKAYFKKYLKEHREEHNKRSREWARKHKQNRSEYAKEYYLKNQALLVERTRKYRSLLASTPEGKAKLAEYQRNYLKSHKRVPYRRIYKEGKVQAEHRWIMERAIGRKLLPNEIVHHLDHNSLNNNIDNLAIMLRGSHSKHHNPRIKFRI